jgi:hypothetical protein
VSSQADQAGSVLPTTELAQAQILGAVRRARRRLLLNLALQRGVASVVAGALLGGGIVWLVSWIATSFANEPAPLPLGSSMTVGAMLLAGATGGAVIGLAIGLAWCWQSVPSSWQVAIEIDARLQSQERVASAWSVLQRGRPSVFGQALLVDAARTLSLATLPHCFPIRQSLQRLLLIPLSLLTLGILWWSLPVSSSGTSAAPSLTSTASDEGPPEASAQEQQRVRWAAERAAQRAEERQRALSEQGWRESAQLLAELEQRLIELQQPQRVDRREALVTMNELRSALEERQQQLSGSAAVRRALASLQRFSQTQDTAATAPSASELASADAKSDAAGSHSGGDPLERLRRLAEQLAPDQTPAAMPDASGPVNQTPADTDRESGPPAPAPGDAGERDTEDPSREPAAGSDAERAGPLPERQTAGDSAAAAAEAGRGDGAAAEESLAAGDQLLMQQLLEELRRLGQATDQEAARETQTSPGPERDSSELRELLESLQAVEEAARDGDPAEVSRSLQQLLEQLSQMEREAGESDQLAGMMQDLERAKQEMQASVDDPNGMATPGADSAGRSGSRPGFGTDGASQPLLDRSAPEAAGAGELYQARGVQSDPSKPGLLAGRALGSGERGDSRQRVVERVTRTEPLTELETGEAGWLPRNHRQQTQQYFDSLRGSPEP